MLGQMVDHIFERVRLLYRFDKSAGTDVHRLPRLDRSDEIDDSQVQARGFVSRGRVDHVLGRSPFGNPVQRRQRSKGDRFVEEPSDGFNEL